MVKYLTEAHKENSLKAIEALNRQGEVDVREEVKKMVRMHKELREREEQLSREKISKSGIDH